MTYAEITGSISIDLDLLADPHVSLVTRACPEHSQLTVDVDADVERAQLVAVHVVAEADEAVAERWLHVGGGNGGYVTGIVCRVGLDVKVMS